jgi:quercetin dioxygenase-like cupin family protein
MRIIRRLAGERPITQFGSVSASVRGVTREGHAVVIEIGAGGNLGRHPATVAQLFVVVSGSGWVSGADGERVAVSVGEAALWEAGEEHESGTDEGMTALVVESERLDVLSGFPD